MKRTLKWGLMLAALLVCLFTGAATAADINHVDYDRVSFAMTDGVVATKSGTDGNVTLTIDVERTDWEKVSINGGLNMRMFIQAPASTADGRTVTGHYGVCFGADSTLQERMDELHLEMQYSYSSRSQTEYSNGVGAGVQNGIVLRPETNQNVVLLCWGDPLGNEDYYAINDAATDNARYYEQATVTVTFSSDSLIYLPTHNAREEWLEPTKDYYANSAVKEIKTSHGQMDLYLKARDQLAEAEMDKPFVLRLTAPEEANQLRITTWQDKTVVVDVINGIAEFTDDELRLVRFNSANDTVSSGRYNLQWCMWDQVIAYGDLQVNIIPDDHDLCAFYQDSLYGVPMQAVPRSRIHVDNQAANCGIQVEVSDGLVRYTHDGTTTAAGDPGEIIVSIEPNEKYSYYRIGGAGGSDVYGHAQGRIEMMYDDAVLDACHKSGESRIAVTGTLPLTTYQAGPMKVYLQTNEIIDWLSAGVNLILWYETEEQAKAENSKPSLIEFVCEEETEFRIPVRLDLVNHEHHITKPVENITIVKPLGREWKDWKLNMRIDPQKGKNAWHYELYLESDTDALRHVNLPKDQPLIVYMPYPEGYSFASEDDFEVYHFENMDGYYKTLEILKPEKTPFGLRFEVTSLSPFVLSVTDTASEEPASVPQTGDNSPLALWILLVAVSAAVATLLIRWRKTV